MRYILEGHLDFAPKQFEVPENEGKTCSAFFGLQEFHVTYSLWYIIKYKDFNNYADFISYKFLTNQKSSYNKPFTVEELNYFNVINAKVIEEKMNKLFKIENGKLILNSNRKFKAKQLQLIQHFIKTQKFTTLLSYLSLFEAKSSPLRQDLRAIRTAKDEITPFIQDKILNRKSGYFWEMQMKQYDIDHDKLPDRIKEGKAIGVEIECFMPPEFSRKKIRDMIMQRKISGITIVGDGSLEASEHMYSYTEREDEDGEITEDNFPWEDMEFRVLTNVDDLSNLEKICKLLFDVGAEVNSTCGLHVHLDARDMNARQASMASCKLVKALPVLTSIVPKSRRTNDRYCQYGRSHRMNGDDRYRMINTTAYNRHKTVEVRLHSGTINYKKISQWVKICYNTFRAKSRHKGNIETIEKLCEFASLPIETRIYMEKRYGKFNTNGVQIPDANHEESEAA